MYTFRFNDGQSAIDIQQGGSATTAQGADGNEAVGLTIWDASLVLAKYVERALPALLEGLPTPPSIIELGSGTGVLGLAVAHMLRFHYAALSASSPPSATQDGSTPALEIPLTAVLTDLPDLLPLLSLNSAALPYEADTDDSDDEMPARSSVALANDAGTPLPLVAVRPLPWGDAVAASQLLAERGGAPFDVVLASDCVYQPEQFAPLVDSLDVVTGPASVVLVAYERRDFDAEAGFFRLLGERFTFRHVPEDEQDPRWRSPEDIYIFVARKRPRSSVA